MTQKSNSSKGKQKKNSIPPIRQGKPPHTRKGKIFVEPTGVIFIDDEDDDPIDSEDNMQDASSTQSLEDAMDSDDDEGYAFVDNDGDDDDSSHRQLNYTILSDDDIRHRQEEVITRVCSVLSISRISAGILLRHYNWSVSNVHDAWFADEGKVRTTVGLLEKPMVPCSNVENVTCGICFENYHRRDMHTANCRHLFCSSCWGSYISTSINDGPGCLMLRCPDPKCGAAVGQDMVNILVSDEDKEKYSRYLLRSYVEANRKAKWCPAPGCDYAVDFVVGSGCFDVTCNCKHSFCWNCLEEAHRPVDCETVSKWILKNSAESENVTWMLANSKPCPKCKRPIEKNNGCMHMTCTPPCNYHFCWLCLGSWTEHGSRTGGYYSCNHYETAKKEGAYDESEKRREMAKQSLERYTHYYERWANNESSRIKAVADFKIMKDVHIEKLSNDQCQLQSQLKFITDAWLQIIECRRVLKWSYAYGYYLPEHDRTKKQFFEYAQGEAESNLERLHHCAEKDLKVYINATGPSEDFNVFRTKLSGLTTVTGKFFENLVRALENGLAEVDSGGGVGACSKTSSSKPVGKKKKPISRGKRTTSRTTSTAAVHIQDDRGWTCEHCTFHNVTSDISCQVCSQSRNSWSCAHCTFFNSQTAAICMMCHQQR